MAGTAKVVAADNEEVDAAADDENHRNSGGIRRAFDMIPFPVSDKDADVDDDDNNNDEEESFESVIRPSTKPSHPRNILALPVPVTVSS